MDDYTPKPIEPRTWSTPTDPDPLLREITDLPMGRRFAIGSAMGVVAWLLFRGAFAIAALHHWIAWAFALLLLEPLGLLAALAAIYTVFPQTPFGRVLLIALRRAKVVLIALFLTVSGGTVVVLIRLLWELYKGR